ncbi:hypothetical protein PITCH_A1500002 [uncultured Desulfobacterium sp.]|uniref:Uncharacterized protein n=1 Tax=uncultured Desulfobacterium sp. TaxID=201089 RepID=A0A445MT95_9BACT|nr:hypothetical protein PITCH_A1500002 [uncultured Desulfobacterium sp.]
MFMKDVKKGNDKIIKNIPNTIFIGIATRNIFILGIVLATSPRLTLVTKREAMTGAQTFTDITNIFPTSRIIYSNNDEFICILNTGRIMKLSLIACIK